MPKLTLLLALSLASLCILGCSHYKPPTSGPTARIRVQTETDGAIVQIHTSVANVCEVTGAKIGVIGSRDVIKDEIAESERSQLRMLGGTSDINPKRLERVVPAERPFPLHFHSIQEKPVGPNTYSYCVQTIQFTPRAGGQYEIAQSFSSSGCHVRVRELIAAEGGFKQVQVDGVTAHKCSWGRDLSNEKQ